MNPGAFKKEKRVGGSYWFKANTSICLWSPSAPSRDEAGAAISADRPVVDTDILAAARDELSTLDGGEDRHRVLLRPCMQPFRR